MTYTERIIDTKDEQGNETYLYCGIDADPENYAKKFHSSEEAIESIRKGIWNNCLLRGYSQEQMDKVFAHYTAKFKEAQIEWGPDAEDNKEPSGSEES